MTFTAAKRPYPAWLGPYSPSRGRYSGLRITGGRLGAWVENANGREFWPAVSNDGIDRLTKLVTKEWGGGRVLLLPNGLVVKPLQRDEDKGRRVLVGRFTGTLALVTPSGAQFDFSAPGRLAAATRWPGPGTVGLECVLRQGGSLFCTWYQPTGYGYEEVREQITGPDPNLYAGFCRARPGDTGGRVRLTAHGHVITNRQQSDGSWQSIYVGKVDTSRCDGWERWIAKGGR